MKTAVSVVLAIVAMVWAQSPGQQFACFKFNNGNDHPPDRCVVKKDTNCKQYYCHHVQESLDTAELQTCPHGQRFDLLGACACTAENTSEPCVANSYTGPV